ncbi:MAG: transglutaminase family protein [Planctomycetales bacterium]|nr:transglutaminase family protein [Planctomycetales bacterium]
MSSNPESCNIVAFEQFSNAIAELDTTAGLLKASVAISRHFSEQGDYRSVRNELDEISATVRKRVISRQQRAFLAHLHEVLFHEYGFQGNREAYYSAENNLLPSVLRSRRGIPITLTLIYKAVAEDLGLYVQGINAPGHFLAEVTTDDDSFIVDAYFDGRLLSREEAFDRIDQVTGQSVPRSDDLLLPSSNAQWISRILNNLQNIFAATGSRRDLVAMTELDSLLHRSQI